MAMGTPQRCVGTHKMNWTTASLTLGEERKQDENHDQSFLGLLARFWSCLC